MSKQIVRLRRAAFKRQRGLCYYCTFPMWLAGCSPGVIRPPTMLECTAEHLIARSEGGRDTAANIVAACPFCNQSRHQLKEAPAPAEYREYVQRRVLGGRWPGKRLQR